MLRGEVLAVPQRASKELEFVGQVHLSERVQSHKLEALAEDVDGLVELSRALEPNSIEFFWLEISNTRDKFQIG